MLTRWRNRTTSSRNILSRAPARHGFSGSLSFLASFVFITSCVRQLHWRLNRSRVIICRFFLLVRSDWYSYLFVVFAVAIAWSIVMPSCVIRPPTLISFACLFFHTHGQFTFTCRITSSFRSESVTCFDIIFCTSCSGRCRFRFLFLLLWCAFF